MSKVDTNTSVGRGRCNHVVDGHRCEADGNLYRVRFWHYADGFRNVCARHRRKMRADRRQHIESVLTFRRAFPLWRNTNTGD